MVIGDRIDTAIYGRIRIGAVYESEAEARADGYHSDAHVKGGDWPYTAWKVLYDGERFAAVKILRGSTGAAQDTARDTRA